MIEPIKITVKLSAVKKGECVIHECALLVNVFSSIVHPRRQKRRRRMVFVDQEFWRKCFRHSLYFVLKIINFLSGHHELCIENNNSIFHSLQCLHLQFSHATVIDPIRNCYLMQNLFLLDTIKLFESSWNCKQSRKPHQEVLR